MKNFPFAVAALCLAGAASAQQLPARPVKIEPLAVYNASGQYVGRYVGAPSDIEGAGFAGIVFSSNGVVATIPVVSGAATDQLQPGSARVLSGSSNCGAPYYILANPFPAPGTRVAGVAALNSTTTIYIGSSAPLAPVQGPFWFLSGTGCPSFGSSTDQYVVTTVQFEVEATALLAGPLTIR